MVRLIPRLWGSGDDIARAESGPTNEVFEILVDKSHDSGARIMVSR